MVKKVLKEKIEWLVTNIRNYGGNLSIRDNICDNHSFFLMFVYVASYIYYYTVLLKLNNSILL